MTSHPLRRCSVADLLRDLRRSSRIFLRAPGLALLAVVAFGLGIGLTTVMFSIVHGAMLRGLPFEEGHRIVAMELANPSQGIDEMALPYQDYLAWEDQRKTLSGMGAYYTGTVNVAGTERPQRFDGAFITAGGLDLLGLRPLLGRLHRPDEDVQGASPTILLGHHVWRDHFGSDPGILGRSLRVNGETATVIGVMPEGFRFPFRQDVWLPLRADRLTPRDEGTRVNVFGRMAPGVDVDQVQMDLSAISARLASAFPETNEGVVPVVQTFVEDSIGDEPRTLLLTMLIAVSFVLLIACFNVANLLLVRAASRSREVAIRTALGARQSRLIADHLMEALVLALAGALLGLGIAAVGIRLFTNAVSGTNPPYWLQFDLNPVVLLFTVGLATAAAVVAGLIPALQASGARTHDLLKDESRGGTSLRLGRLTRGLVVGEVALSVALLASAGLMIRSIVNVGNLELSYTPEQVFSARVGLFETDFPTVEERRAFWTEVDERLRTLPGVEATALTSVLPATGGGAPQVMLQGEVYPQDRDVPRARSIIVTPGFETVVGMGLLEGRLLGTEDDAGATPAAMVSRGFVERFFPGGGSPLGRQLRFGVPSSPDAPWLTIVGVVEDQFHSPDDDFAWAVYTPLAQSDARFMSIVARVEGGDPMTLTPQVRELVASVHADTPIYFVQHLGEALRQQTWFYTVFGVLFAAFGAAALFLASVGLYGVLAFSVRRRTAELGIRMALGADARQVRTLILRQGFLQIGIGLVIGMGLALLLGGALGSFLFQVQPRDPLVLLGTAGLLLLTGMLASILPVRRATRVDPMVALRS